MAKTFQLEGKECQSGFLKSKSQLYVVYKRCHKNTNKFKLKEWKKLYYKNINYKKAGVAIFIKPK